MSNFDDFLSNPNEDLVVSSPIPKMCKKQEVMVGIDEAGRGPVLGKGREEVGRGPVLGKRREEVERGTVLGKGREETGKLSYWEDEKVL